MAGYCSDFLINAIKGFNEVVCAAMVEDKATMREAACKGFGNLTCFAICKLVSSNGDNRESGNFRTCTC